MLYYTKTEDVAILTAMTLLSKYLSPEAVKLVHEAVQKEPLNLCGAINQARIWRNNN